MSDAVDEANARSLARTAGHEQEFPIWVPGGEFSCAVGAHKTLMTESTPSGLTFVEAAKIKLALAAADVDSSPVDPAAWLTGAERARLIVAVDRATVKPTNCSHDSWEWPMPICPTCGADGAKTG